MSTKLMTSSLRLPVSLKSAVERLADADGTSMNQFLVMAAAEKVSAMETADAFFAARGKSGDRQAALLFLREGGGQPAAIEDQLSTDPK